MKKFVRLIAVVVCVLAAASLPLSAALASGSPAPDQAHPAGLSGLGYVELSAGLTSGDTWVDFGLRPIEPGAAPPGDGDSAEVAAPIAWELSQAELHYHRDTTAHMQNPVNGQPILQGSRYAPENAETRDIGLLDSLRMGAATPAGPAQTLSSEHLARDPGFDETPGAAASVPAPQVLSIPRPSRAM